MRPDRRWWWGVVVPVLAAGAWLARERWRRAPQLPTAQATRGDLVEYVPCRGKLGVRQAALLRAPAQAQNLRIAFLAPGGSRVQAGAVVVRLDTSAAREQEEQLRLALQSALATLDQAQAQAGITHQQDALAAVNDQVAVDHARLEAQRASVASKIAGEEAQLTLATAKAELAQQQAQARLHAQAAAAQLASLRAERDKAAAQLQRQRAVVAGAVLRAPIPGFISYMTNPGSSYDDPQPYRPGDQVSAGDRIAEIPALQTLVMQGQLDQSERGQAAVGEAVEVQVAALPESTFAGRVEAISALTTLDFGNDWPPPRYFQVTAALTHPDARLRPQMSATMRIITRRLSGVVLVPAQAVFTPQGRPLVYVDRGGRWVALAVRVLGRNPTQEAVAGLAAGTPVALEAPGTGRAGAAAPALPGGAQ